MNLTKTLTGLLIIITMIGCSRNKLEQKGFSVSQQTSAEGEENTSGIAKDSLILKTRPGGILLTGNSQYRLTTVYLVNYNKRTETTFIGSDNFYENYAELGNSNGNYWHENFLPGLEAVYGYNMVNISLFDTKAQKSNYFFNKPVLIKTLYFPSFTNDTLNYKPVLRNYYLISVYDEDSNGDGLINIHDLRHFYYIDSNAQNKTLLVPMNYSVLRSEYDPANDYMYVFAKIDTNKNGTGDDDEALHIFWIDLKNPLNNGLLY